MNKFLNSPICIAVLAIAALFILNSNSSKGAKEVRGIYEELLRIAEEGQNDAQKSKAVKNFAQEMASQMKAGFTDGFASGDEEKDESREAKFLRLKNKVVVKGLKEVSSDSKGRQEFIYTLKNETAVGIKQLRVNYEFFRAGELIDAKNDWMSEVKALGPGESIAMKENRSVPRTIPEDDRIDHLFDEVTVTVTSFDVIEH